MLTIVGRRFGVADGLILVAATAIGLAASRAITPDELTLQATWEAGLDPPQGGWSLLFIVQFACILIDVAVIPSLAAWTIACLALRLRGPRPPWRRLARRPGMVACLAATLALGISAAAGMASRLMTAQEYNALAWLGWQIMIGFRSRPAWRSSGAG